MRVFIVFVVMIGVMFADTVEASNTIQLEWSQDNPSDYREYLARGAEFVVITEEGGNSRENINYSAAIFKGNADWGNMIIRPIQPCWSVTVKGNVPGYNGVLSLRWEDTNCKEKVYLPLA